MVITREYVDVPVGERAMRTFVAAPAAAGSYPGVVFYTDIFQLTEPSLRWAVRLAGYGFVVAVPEIYHRVEPAGTVLEFDDAGKVRGQADADATPVAGLRRRRGSCCWRGSRRAAPRSAPPGTARAGTSRSGPRSPTRVRGTVCWYPTGLHDGKLGKEPTDSLARAGEIDGEILLIFGVQDPHTPAAGREVIHRGMADTRATRGSSTRPSTRSGATSARASIPR